MAEHKKTGDHSQSGHYRQIEQAIVALEAQRAALGNAVVDMSRRVHERDASDT